MVSYNLFSLFSILIILIIPQIILILLITIFISYDFIMFNTNYITNVRLTIILLISDLNLKKIIVILEFINFAIHLISTYIIFIMIIYFTMILNLFGHNLNQIFQNHFSYYLKYIINHLIIKVLFIAASFNYNLN